MACTLLIDGGQVSIFPLTHCVRLSLVTALKQVEARNCDGNYLPVRLNVKARVSKYRFHLSF